LQLKEKAVHNNHHAGVPKFANMGRYPAFEAGMDSVPVEIIPA